jgi:hypothetical protein
MGKSSANRKPAAQNRTTQTAGTNTLRAPQLRTLARIQTQLNTLSTQLGQITASFGTAAPAGGKKKQPQRAMAAGQTAQG